ncbi:MAG TPA: hypothetical protein VHP56_12165 [Solirubrobacterales bacterium]|jgi:hypothetical protein|nr:hypothetical protein [Solirubrobacterales bacterium]
MEAAIAEKEAGMTEWNDDRLDEFRERVDGIDRKMDEGFGMVRKELTRIDQKIDNKFDAFYRLMLQAAVGLIVGILGLLGVLIGVVGAQV